MSLPDTQNRVGLVLTGGGARGAYQVGVLRWIARHFPGLRIPILTGVSAGAVNVAKLACAPGTFAQAVDELGGLWNELTPDRIFRVGAPSLGRQVLRWGLRLVSGGSHVAPRVRGFLDTAPLRELLEETYAAVNGQITGIDYNLHRGTLRAVAVVTTSYSTGQTVTFAHGKDVEPWRRPLRVAVPVPLTVDHVMASAALPIFFPAVRIGETWHGDGGIRLAAPLSPALHLGADRILAVSTRYDKSRAEQDAPEIVDYPPPAQVLGTLLNAVFLDLVDQDAVRLERLNQLLDTLPEEKRLGLRKIRLLVLRPSQDLGRLSAKFEPQLPRAFRFMTRGLGTRETRSPDVLSMLMFQPDYLGHLMDIGEEDAERRAEEIEAFFRDSEVPEP